MECTMVSESDIRDMQEISGIAPGSIVEYKRTDGITVAYMFDRIVGDYAQLYPIDNQVLNPVYCDLTAKFYVR